ncbi:OOP family OmpA-OmpF porin [Palleronia aestuarii]|uniref:OOP family OmpA-OmpF porin n=2 Tax=Palleronia aestuarii TaxID=568105 RepID=A0A2W7NG29_9RHOB|nr:OOP family OmpA-OmpF porin [Palleronia aestuarii]
MPLVTASPAAATPLSLDFPAAARETVSDRAAESDIALPAGPWQIGGPPVRRAEGTILRRAWRLTDRNLTTLQILEALRRQIVAAGYEIAFECADATCGGYDFRFAANVLGAPEMYVDLGDFRYLLAERPDGTHPLSLMVSRAPGAGFVQLTEVLSRGETDIPLVSPQDTEGRATAEDLRATLMAEGHVVLDGLTFRAGAATLGDNDSPSLAALAGILKSDPGLRVVLVGHTDAQGGLDANLALSRRRAASVRQTLVERYGVSPGQLTADGIAFLAPRRSNATEEGRRANRRVEAVLSD